MVAEVMQETYLAAWRAAASFVGVAGESSAAGWLWTIAARRLVDVLRRRARDARLPLVVLPVEAAPAAEDEVLLGTLGDPMAQALRRLAPELRQVLQAMVLDGLTVVLVAVSLDLANEEVGGRVPSLVLLLAPVAPLLPVAAAWSRRLDPAYELAAASARAGLELVLRRTVAVLVVVIPALGVAGWQVGVSPARWLLPCLAFTAGALALGQFLGLHRAATGLAVCWAVIVVGPSLITQRPPAALGPASFPVWALATVAITVVLVVFRPTYHMR